MNLWALWGKTQHPGDVGDSTHALLYHLLDVAAVADALWERSLAEATRQHLAQLMAMPVEDARRTVAFLAGLHDVGKACPAFQMQHPPAIAALRAAGYGLPLQSPGRQCYHGTVSARALQEGLSGWLGENRRGAIALSRALGGHHGAWPTSPELQALKTWQLGGDEWREARSALVDTLAGVLQPPPSLVWPENPAEGNALTTLVSGLTSVADWIGSMNRFFPYRAAPTDPAGYLRDALCQAHHAIEEVHWDRLPLPVGEEDFDKIFPAYTPNPVQRAAMDVAPRLHGPSLVIIEAPTGMGKTEAALYLAERLAGRHGQPGLYIAMPTMATSNQMHDRLHQLVARRHPLALGGPMLVHSQALWQGPPPTVGMDDHDARRDALAAMAWFLPRKRSLLAPFGVGTVDQAFLGVLQTRHFFVRLLGLAHKVVIFDEVHAYDAYMTELFQRLLGWLRAVGSSVIILSATLSSVTRERLLAAYGGAGEDPEPTRADAPSYPAIHWQTEDGGGAIALDGCTPRTVRLAWLPRGEEAIVTRLRERLAQGGAAAVICNTVGRAQALYEALRQAALVEASDLILFHARYPYAWREEIERGVLARFGKGHRRRAEERAIVVATQVIEQSLDLDFDDMVTDLAPVDLLIQRAGRLHRHAREAWERPAALGSPTLAITLPPMVDGCPEWAEDGLIYEPYVLFRTLAVIRGRAEVRTPEDTAALIAAVYDEDAEPGGLAEPLRRAMATAREEMGQRLHTEVYEARRRLIASPADKALVRAHNDMLHEEDPRVHESLQALTRLSPPGVSLVCLHRQGERVVAEPGCSEPIDLDIPPGDALTRVLVRRMVTVTHRGVLAALQNQAVPAAWERHALLRHCRLALFTDGLCRLPESPYALRLTRALGLQIIKEVP